MKTILICMALVAYAAGCTAYSAVTDYHRFAAIYYKDGERRAYLHEEVRIDVPSPVAPRKPPAHPNAHPAGR